jgi:hypothetical protein
MVTYCNENLWLISTERLQREESQNVLLSLLISSADITPCNDKLLLILMTITDIIFVLLLVVFARDFL